RPDVLHRVVDRGQRRERATWRVDVQRDVAVRVLGLEHDQLGDDVVRRGVVDLHPEEDDPVLEQLGVGVEPLHAVRRALLELREDVAAAGRGHLTAPVVIRKAREVEVHRGRPAQSFVPPPVAALTDSSTTWSTNPYSWACSAVNQRSRSESASIWSTVWPVCWAIRAASCFLMCSI